MEADFSFIEMLPSLDNFVSYGTDVFRARADYRQKALDIYTTALSSENLGENDRVNGCKLAESLLLNLRGHIDDVCPPPIPSRSSLLMITCPNIATRADRKSTRLNSSHLVISYA